MAHEGTERAVAAAQASAADIARITEVPSHEVAVILGSGWAHAADLIGAAGAAGDGRIEMAVTDIAGFEAPTVPGHAGRVLSVDAGGRPALVFVGRTHLYEGRGTDAVVHSVRTAAAAGCRVLVLTNGCGGLQPRWSPGTPVLIKDHINMTGRSPLHGATFIDLTNLYSARLRALCHEVDPTLDEGVYVQLPGPHYETPAEIAMIRAIGGDLVGMSTALEAIAAREAGMEVLGISLVTNQAAGTTGEPITHEEVLEAGRNAAERMGRLIDEVLRRL